MNDFKIILDSPPDVLALGFDQTADPLKEIIEVSKSQFVIGIFGSWGSGAHEVPARPRWCELSIED